MSLPARLPVNSAHRPGSLPQLGHEPPHEALLHGAVLVPRVVPARHHPLQEGGRGPLALFSMFVLFLFFQLIVWSPVDTEKEKMEAVLCKR